MNKKTIKKPKRIVTKKKPIKLKNRFVKEIKLLLAFGLLFFFVGIMLAGKITYDHTGAMTYAEGIYADNGTQGICDSVNGFMIKDRCLLNPNIDYTTSDEWYDFHADCSWGKLMTRVSESPRLSFAEKLKLRYYRCEWVGNHRV